MEVIGIGILLATGFYLARLILIILTMSIITLVAFGAGITSLFQK